MVKARTKRNGLHIFLRIIAIILCVLIALFMIANGVSAVGNDFTKAEIAKISKVISDDLLDTPKIDKDTGYYTFTCDRTFKVIQFTDVHIGGGFLSSAKDKLAVNALADLVSYTKPDLVIITGDIAYPVPFQAGTFNNLASATLFAETMEKLGVYWTITFGNHDTEVYSYYEREKISDFYENSGFRHCLFQRGSKDVYGYGNYFINVENSDGIITQSLCLIDSNSYKKGFLKDYDNIHQDQIDWYESEIKRMDTINKNNGAKEIFKSLAFFHIPLKEYETVYNEYTAAGNKDTTNVKWIYGVRGEPACCGTAEDTMFETMLRLKSTQGVFCGHDHVNNYSCLYNGGSGNDYIRLTYGMSIDYLAYKDIDKQTEQRGCTVINIAPDGEFDCYGLRMVDKKVIK